MAHWAQIDENNIVIQVLVGSNDDSDEGYQWLIDNIGGTWLKTSYTARGGQKVNPNTNEPTGQPGYRYNYAGIGYTWDATALPDGAFIPPKPTEGEWVLNTNTYLWEPVVI